MKRSHYSLVVCSVALMTFAWAAAALAQSKSPGETAPQAGPNCDLTGYKSTIQTFPTPIPIPDNTGASVTVGPILEPFDGTLFDDVILDLRLTHTWVGDLIVTLSYYQDCASPVAAASTRVLCRQRGTNAVAPSPCGTGTGFGCSGDLSCNNLYLFSDDAIAPMAEGVCPTLIAGGCYRPASGNTMAVFRGLAKGGCFRLNLVDLATVDSGAICEWSIHTRNTGPVPTHGASWGKVKTIYR